MESSRRQQAQADLGMNFTREDQKREAALAKEQERVARKEAKRQQMMSMPSYRRRLVERARIPVRLLQSVRG